MEEREVLKRRVVRLGVRGRSCAAVAEYASCACWRKFGPFVESEVQARQSLNAETALARPRG